MNDNVIQMQPETEAEKLIGACEDAGVHVHVKTDQHGVFPLFELHKVTDPVKAMSAMMALRLTFMGSEGARFRIDMTNYAFNVGSTMIDGYVVPPLWCDDGGAKVIGDDDEEGEES